MSSKSKPIHKTRDSEMSATERSGWGPDPAFDDWDAWDEIDRKQAAHRGTATPMPTADEVRASDTTDTPRYHGTSTGVGSAQQAPTERQLGYLASLLRQLGNDDAQNTIDLMAKAPNWSRHTCSQAIDSFKAAVEKQAAEAPVPAPARKPNRYAGKCHLCGQHVEAEQGYLAGEPGAWTVEHVTCPPKPADPLVESSGAVDLPAVAGGHYAIESTGNNDLVFYRVDRPTEGKWAGRTFVKMVVGGHPDQPVKRESVRGILERIAADPLAAQRYGQEIGRCYRCNRSLTDQTSRELGIGPECRRREE